jgi:SAM-dependent methyltransferase
METASSIPGTADTADKARRAVDRARQAAGELRQAAATQAERDLRVRELFAQPVRDYVHVCLGRPLELLRAGRRTPLEELGLDKLRAGGFEINVTTVDQDLPLGRSVTEIPSAPDNRGSLEDEGKVVLGDLRTVPLTPRSFDVVHCAQVLEHIPHVGLVLDRFAAALRPGGLLLLQVRDRECAAGLLDRKLPRAARRAIWTRLHPGEPGPFPAVYERMVSAPGIQEYVQMRGLVIAQRGTTRSRTAQPGAGRPGAGRRGAGQPQRLSRLLSVVCAGISWLTRGRRTDAYDQLLYVIRKPEDRFARVLLTVPGR